MYSLKSLGSSIGVILLTLIIGLVGIESYNAYMMNHTYYYDMLANFTNWKLIILLGAISLLPLWIIFKKKNFHLGQLGWSWIIMMIVGGFFHVINKGGLIGTTGSVIFLMNMVVIFALIAIFLGGLYTGGARLYKKYFRPELTNWSDIMFSLGLGLGIFLLINYILVFSQLFFPLLTWLQLIGFGYLIWSQKTTWKELNSIIGLTVSDIRGASINQKVIFGILLGLSLIYMLLGFNLSFIPYSTAWDANHAYMYFPKVWSLNNGLFFSEGPVTTPHLWMVYISYWFSLFKPLSSWFNLAPDTIAVIMNNISGWFALFFGMGALSTIINYFKEKKIITSDTEGLYGLSIGWMYFLLWLMSGMGAFLVFVDNKTDLGVMSLTLLAIMSGFMFIQSISHKNLEHFSRKISHNLPALLSGFFFSLAVLSKPTAFQDVIIFLLFLVGTFIGLFGVFGIFLLVLAILGKAEAMSMVFYISKNFATKIGLLGLIGSATQVIVSRKNRLRQVSKPILYRGLCISIFLFLFKGSYLITYQLINKNFSVSNIVKGVLLSKNSNKNQKISNNTIALVADTGESSDLFSGDSKTFTGYVPTIKSNQCSLSSANLTKDNLYNNLKEVEGGGLIEDFGRYIGYGQRVFSHPATWTEQEASNYGSIKLGYRLVTLFFHTPGCYSFNRTADHLCEDPSLGKSQEGIQSLMDSVSSESGQYKFLVGIDKKYEILKQEQDSIRESSLSKEIEQAVSTYVQGNVVQVSKDPKGYISVAVPYAFLTPLNVIFNWSLQNLSSYYTDIGFIWILSLILLLAGTIYSIYNNKKDLTLLHLVTLCGWILWWFLASGIIWYAVGIIAWTTFCNAIFLGQLLTKKGTPIATWSIRILVGIVILTGTIQTLFNLNRIASQGSSGPFTRYKGSTGKETEFVFNGQGGFGQKEIIQYNYNAKNVFDLQFGHYNAFIDHVKDRKNEDGILIAGTYLQYFLKNQNNISADGLLTTLWQRGSDGNTCNLELRLEDKKIKYLVIDPNIGSVVMGDGNSSLFDRFFAKIDSNSNTIISDGTMTMLVRMVQEGYLKLISTNNVGVKYAYTLSDKEILDNINALSDEQTKTYLLKSFESDKTLFRAKLAIPRFFSTEANYYFALIAHIFQTRLSTNEGISDIADILGKQINTINISKAFSLINSSKGSINLTKLNQELTNDERTILGYYMTIQSRLESNDTSGAQEIISQLLQNSVAGGSQLITFERIN